MKPGKLMLVRHGQSIWNLENLLHGLDRCRSVAARLRRGASGRPRTRARRGGYPIWSSPRCSSAPSAPQWLMLEELDLLWLPVERSWRLNERHYGALQGLNKAQTAERHGEAQVKIWRRSYDIPPPPLDAG